MLRYIRHLLLLGQHLNLHLLLLGQRHEIVEHVAPAISAAAVIDTSRSVLARVEIDDGSVSRSVPREQGLARGSSDARQVRVVGGGRRVRRCVKVGEEGLV